MMISAHPDDIEACAGGTVRQLTAQGTRVVYLIATNGDKGCAADFCANWTAERIAYQRQQEAINAAAVLGVKASDVVLLDYEDAMLTSYPEVQVRQQVIAVIRRFQPHVVMTWFGYPIFSLQPSAGWGDLGYHPDHQAIGRIALAAQFEAGLPLLFPESGAAWPISEFYMWSFVDITHYSNIQTTLQAKINAYLQHKTQYPDPQLVQQGLTMLARQVAVNTPGFTGNFAEGFLAYF